jgi:hypothetical protein
MGLREHLPTRRRSESRKIIWQSRQNVDTLETKLFGSIGYAEDVLCPVEILYDGGYLSGADLETLVSDLIQHDEVQIESFVQSLSKELDRCLLSNLTTDFMRRVWFPKRWLRFLGSTKRVLRVASFWFFLTRLRTHNQNMTVAARAIADRNTLGHRSYRVATRRQFLSLPNMRSILFRLL